MFTSVIEATLKVKKQINLNSFFSCCQLFLLLTTGILSKKFYVSVYNGNFPIIEISGKSLNLQKDTLLYIFYNITFL